MLAHCWWLVDEAAVCCMFSLAAATNGDGHRTLRSNATNRKGYKHPSSFSSTKCEPQLVRRTSGGGLDLDNVIDTRDGHYAVRTRIGFDLRSVRRFRVILKLAIEVFTRQR